MGTAVEFEDFLPLGWLGAYSLHECRIYLLRGMAPVHERSVLAHELGHAYYGDAGSSPANEARADRWAANELITAEDYRWAYLGAPSLPVIADRLGVTLHVAQTYRAMDQANPPTGSLRRVAA